MYNLSSNAYIHHTHFNDSIEISHLLYIFHCARSLFIIYREIKLFFIVQIDRQIFTSKDSIHFGMNFCLNIWMRSNQITRIVDSGCCRIMSLVGSMDSMWRERTKYILRTWMCRPLLGYRLTRVVRHSFEREDYPERRDDECSSSQYYSLHSQHWMQSDDVEWPIEQNKVWEDWEREREKPFERGRG